MRHNVTLYVREHLGGWFTASVLGLGAYAAYGPKFSELRDELEAALAEDLTAGQLRLPAGGEPWVHRSHTMELRAVQYQRLITVPLRFSYVYRPVSKRRELLEVHLPRFDEVFTLAGEENVVPWSEEVLRGHLHLKDVAELVRHQYDRVERIEPLEVTVGRVSAKKARRAGTPSREEDELAPERPHGELGTLGTELVAEATAGRLEKPLYRDDELARLAEVLASRRQPAALLLGPSGAGKTALVHGLAHAIASESAPARLLGAKLWDLPAGRLVAGMRFLGEWQGRAQRILHQVVNERGILFLGHLGELLALERGDRGHRPADFLKPVLEAGELTLILEATPDALTLAERRDPGLLRLLQRVTVPPLQGDAAKRILQAAAKRLERQHGVELPAETIDAALSVILHTGGAASLPGSGLRLLSRMVTLADPAPHPGRPKPVPRRAAVQAYSKETGFPEALLDPDHPLDPAELRAFFADRVIGQPEAIERFVEAILLLKAGLADPTRPLGSFLLMGPTGVGKTESALTLARYFFGDEKRLLRFDMSEYAEPGSALRLVDGPDGQGELTKKLRAQPFSVLLFDEVEKADPSVFDLFLQILGEGRLTDGTGQTLHLTHALIVLTSNLGASAKAPVGFASETGATRGRRYLEAAERFFRPELINRLDHIVPYASLGDDALATIARRMLDEATRREGFTRRGLELIIEESVIARVIRAGTDPRYGARPLKRAVETEVVVPLAKRLMDAPPAGGRWTLAWGPEGLEILTAP